MVQQVGHILRDGLAAAKLLSQRIHLLLGGDLTSQQKPQETLRLGLTTGLILGQALLNLRDGQAAEADTL